MGLLSKAVDLFNHPDEFWPMVQMYSAVRAARRLPKDASLRFCYEILNNVSRSFAVVIQQLPVELRDATCVFYLVLRGLDTVEDDMAIPVKVKLPELLAFHERIRDRQYTYSCGEGEYKRLMENFGHVVDAFLALKKVYQDAITDVTKEMGEGMAKFIETEVTTLDQYDEYCHYVAGLVGEGLSALFTSSQLEGEVVSTADGLSNHMGLHLQKTNIIRDYLEDILEEPAPRMFWPKEIWGEYADSLATFKDPGQRPAAVGCLNHMITDALRHVVPALEYLELLQDPAIFRFCAIPQVMAIGTLSLCYSNGGVFESAVKMRRGETCKIFAACRDMRYVYEFFGDAAADIRARATAAAARDAQAESTMKALDAISAACDAGIKRIDGLHSRAAMFEEERAMANAQPLEWWVRLAWMTMALLYAAYAFNVGAVRVDLGLKTHAGSPMFDGLQKLMAVAFLLFACTLAARGKKV